MKFLITGLGNISTTGNVLGNNLTGTLVTGTLTTVAQPNITSVSTLLLHSSTDGVVLLYSSLPGGSAAPYNEGRTATHEVGHYLNLRHIWGDGRCRQDDFVADTPSSDGANYGCPSYPTVNCKSTDMTMNYMDYTDDACMYMFSLGQKDRMRAIFASGGSRESLAQ